MRVYLGVITVLILWSCNDLVNFDQPQPMGKSNLTKIPNRIQGVYASDGESSLIINEQMIVEKYDIAISTLIDSLDFDFDSTKIEGNILRMTVDNFKVRLNFKGDSVECKYSASDTLFQLSDHQILRKFRGHYFLNDKRSENNWNVRIVTIKNGILTFSKVKGAEQIERLKDITDVEEIKNRDGKITGYHLNPSKQEMKQILKVGFQEDKRYRKIQ